MSYDDYEFVETNLCLCGHPWWDHGDGLDNDHHKNCEVEGCCCLEFKERVA